MAASRKVERRNKIKMRIRKVVSGTAEMPRMSVFRSNKQIAVQLIDDVEGKTLASASSLSEEIAGGKVTKTQKAELVGAQIAKAALDAGISTVKFDRGGYLYHGRVKALADAARNGGLKF